MADLLHAGTRDDDRAYSPSLLSRGWAILENLAEKVVPAQEADERDPMTAAINTGKGRTLEAIFSHALREARLADKDGGNHDAVWKRLQPRFDLELEKCKTGNYEFSTLAGAYLGNLEYLSTDWLRASIPLMFPSERPANLSAALSGLAYSAATRRSYVMLRDATVVDSALRIEAKGRDTRKMLVERIMLAYLWGDETLESPRVSYLFQNGLVDDLQAAGWFFSTVRGDRLSPEQRAKVVAFWNRCITWAQGQATPPDKLLGTLAALAWSLDDAQGRNGELLLAVAPYKNIDHGSYEFLEELLRLANTSPTTVALVVGAMIKTSSQMYDYKGVLKSLLATLAQLGQRAVVLQYCDQLRQVDGIPELFTRLRSEVH